MKTYLLAFLLLSSIAIQAQDDTDADEKKGFKKENLFTGGSVSLQFGSGSFTGGINPVLGYSITRWLDGGIAINYTYATAKNFTAVGDRIKQHVYGGGVFTRIFPVKFIFVQGQVEHNFLNVRYTPSLAPVQKYNASATSYLVGGGYTTGRDPDQKNPYFYVSIFFDLGGDDDSPYVNGSGDAEPIYRAGVNIPLFQGKRNR
jgi:hypothetical protein